MTAITVQNYKRETAYKIPSDATHYMFGASTGVYYKVCNEWIHKGDNGEISKCMVNANDYSKYFNQKIYEVKGSTHDKPINNVDYVKEAKDRINGAFGSFPVGHHFISNGFIKRSNIMKGSGWRIGDGDGFTSRFIIAHPKTDLDLLSEFAPDFTKHKDCDIAVIRDIVEQYRNKIKQLQESKK